MLLFCCCFVLCQFCLVRCLETLHQSLRSQERCYFVCSFVRPSSSASTCSSSPPFLFVYLFIRLYDCSLVICLMHFVCLLACLCVGLLVCWLCFHDCSTFRQHFVGFFVCCHDCLTFRQQAKCISGRKNVVRGRKQSKSTCPVFLCGLLCFLVAILSDGKVCASSAGSQGSLPGRAAPVTSTVIISALAPANCQTPGAIGSVLGMVSPV